MTVLHVIPSVSPVHGGPSFAQHLIERALVKEGIDVTVATTDDDGPGEHMDVPLGPENKVFPAGVLHGNKNGGGTRLYFRKQTEFYKISVPLWRWLQRSVSKFDIIHIHALFSFSSVAAARCARSRGVPYIIRPLGVLNRYGMTKRRPVLKNFSFRFLERPILRHAAAIHYTSHQEQQEAEAVLKGERGAGSKGPGAKGGERGVGSGEQAFRSLVLPLGIDLAAFASLPGARQFLERWPQARNRDVICFIGRLDPIKNLDALISAFAEVRRRFASALLVIAGEGTHAFVEGLKKRADELGVAKDIIWTGFLDGDLKLSALAAAKVFVLPSFSENFGIAAVEALAAGVPTVITTGVGIAKDVRQNEAGLVVEPNASDIASAIERLLNNSELAQRVSSNGARLAQERYSMEAMGAALKACYEQILQRAKR